MRRLQLRPRDAPWSLPWVVFRYLPTSFIYLTPRRGFNALLALAEMRLARRKVRSGPVVLRIEPCNVCPLRCPDCAAGIGTDARPKGFLSLPDLRQILEQTKDTAFIVRLDGMGEPTLHPRFFDLIRLIKTYHMSVTVSSNFMTSNCDKADEFIDCGLDSLIVAVDGATQDVYQLYRIGGELAAIERRVRQLVQRKQELGAKRPLIEIQCLDLDCNRHQINEVRELAKQWRADRFVVTAADPAVKKAQGNLPKNPKHCFWLWFVLTVGWNLDYRSCTNAWSLPWPGLNLRQVPVDEYWNHRHVQEARAFNKNRQSDYVVNDVGCKCNRCYEMLVCRMPGDRYFCE